MIVVNMRTIIRINEIIFCFIDLTCLLFKIKIGDINVLL